MSTGKRLAKRSIIGTRVCAPGDSGKWYSGIICDVKSSSLENSNCIQLTVNTRYSVRFDTKAAVGKRGCREFRECELIGPGFGSVTGVLLSPGQKVFITFNGRETSGEVVRHNRELDEVVIVISPPGQEGSLEVVKRLDEVRLLESRKSARLMDQDTDFARLADMAGAERKRQSALAMLTSTSHCIDVPHHGSQSRKRRTSCSHDDMEDFSDDLMDECSAALVLMSLSCSPKSSHITGGNGGEYSPIDGNSSSASWRSGTPSPPLSEEGSAAAYWRNNSTASDEGIVVDYTEELPRKKKANRTVFQCTWPGCAVVTSTCSTIEAHVRNQHLGPREGNAADDELSDHEEEFYYTEAELEEHHSSAPTMSHQDMARPPHEDPEFQRQIVGNIRMELLASGNHASPIMIPSSSNSHQQSHHSLSHHSSYTLPTKHHRLSPRPVSAFPYPSPSSPPALLSLSAPTRVLPSSPSRRLRGENKKCRKVYGMEHRELWCTQCKWKKACSRFGD